MTTPSASDDSNPGNVAAVESDHRLDVLDRLLLVESRLSIIDNKVTAVLTAMQNIESHIKPALDAISNGGIMSMLMGRRKG